MILNILTAQVLQMQVQSFEQRYTRNLNNNVM
jgi:hypothetical protein